MVITFLLQKMLRASLCPENIVSHNVIRRLRISLILASAILPETSIVEKARTENVPTVVFGALHILDLQSSYTSFGRGEKVTGSESVNTSGVPTQTLALIKVKDWVYFISSLSALILAGMQVLARATFKVSFRLECWRWLLMGCRLLWSMVDPYLHECLAQTSTLVQRPMTRLKMMIQAVSNTRDEE